MCLKVLVLLSGGDEPEVVELRGRYAGALAAVGRARKLVGALGAVGEAAALLLHSKMFYVPFLLTNSR